MRTGCVDWVCKLIVCWVCKLVSWAWVRELALGQVSVYQPFSFCANIPSSFTMLSLSRKAVLRELFHIKGSSYETRLLRCIVANQLTAGARQHHSSSRPPQPCARGLWVFKWQREAQRLNYSFHSTLRLAPGFIGDHFLDSVSGVMASEACCTYTRV